MQPKVSLIVIDPLLSAGRRGRMTQALGWNDPQRLADAFIDDLQIAVSELHRELSETWFLPLPPEAAEAS